ncbi:hypothetical protein TVAG_265790 [Trichomonas vaginalis G3]|uniref:Uncharacterized protein n=1 Tax=Trichomonas vaginalis (strain ATCC PRA-98 / G3) TaxID=412133 RepID=A2F2H6_TRIV3|nr:hypothetical protein TVAGG3_0980430 [Trichomonas vaginalis G3]EAY00876.1 hypothetical protein TVAG_265790 [Trichomonas vaginalis G3]KAI5489251.1 hypothetical protein TVAGG3_0980430 [Trichomonas vaginalis G3]|eukprot:XP_001313805.1 hypothetical protein [Trichomonas vaginalis G3]
MNSSYFSPTHFSNFISIHVPRLKHIFVHQFLKSLKEIKPKIPVLIVLNHSKPSIRNYINGELFVKFRFFQNLDSIDLCLRQLLCEFEFTSKKEDILNSFENNEFTLVTTLGNELIAKNLFISASDLIRPVKIFMTTQSILEELTDNTFLLYSRDYSKFTHFNGSSDVYYKNVNSDTKFYTVNSVLKADNSHMFILKNDLYIEEKINISEIISRVENIHFLSENIIETLLEIFNIDVEDDSLCIFKVKNENGKIEYFIKNVYDYRELLEDRGFWRQVHMSETHSGLVQGKILNVNSYNFKRFINQTYSIPVILYYDHTTPTSVLNSFIEAAKIMEDYPDIKIKCGLFNTELNENKMNMPYPKDIPTLIATTPFQIFSKFSGEFTPQEIVYFMQAAAIVYNSMEIEAIPEDYSFDVPKSYISDFLKGIFVKCDPFGAGSYYDYRYFMEDGDFMSDNSIYRDESTFQLYDGIDSSEENSMSRHHHGHPFLRANYANIYDVIGSLKHSDVMMHDKNHKEQLQALIEKYGNF